MVTSFRFSGLVGTLTALFFMLPATAQVSPETQTEIDALRERVTDLRANELVLQSEIREIGGAATTEQGITNSNWRRHRAERQIEQLREIVEAHTRNAEEMEQMQRQVEQTIDERINQASSTGDKVKNQALIQGGRMGLDHLLAAETGPLLSLGIKLIDYAGRKIVADFNEDDLGEMVLTERRNLVKVMEVIVGLTHETAHEIRTVRQLEDLQQQFNENLDALATAQQRLDILTGNAHHEANLERETDPAGDAAEIRKTQGSGVRLCNPRERHKPTGVRLSRKSTDAKDKISKDKTDKMDKPVAEGTACKDIIGFWSFTTTVQLGERKVSTPPMFVEIMLAEGGEITTYEFFQSGKNKVTNKTTPIMRCTLEETSLTCQRRAQPQVCPAEKYVWEPMEIQVATDVSSMTGEFRQTQTFDMNADPSGCTLTPFDGLGTLTYRFEPAN